MQWIQSSGSGKKVDNTKKGASANFNGAVNAGAGGPMREQPEMMAAMAKERERHVETSTYNLLRLSSYTQSSEWNLNFTGQFKLWRECNLGHV